MLFLLLWRSVGSQGKPRRTTTSEPRPATTVRSRRGAADGFPSAERRRVGWRCAWLRPGAEGCPGLEAGPGSSETGGDDAAK